MKSCVARPGRWRWSLLGCAWLLALVACRKQPEADRHDSARRVISVQIGYQKTGAPFLLKQRSQALVQRLARAGAEPRWIEFQAGPVLLEAMRGGGVDIGHTGEAPPIFAQAGGVPFVYVAADPSSPAAEAILVRKESPLQQLSELKGRKIALNRGSNVHYLLLRALERAGLSPSDVEVVYLAPPDARSAFETGSVDAWVIWDPFQAAAEIKGARVLADGEGLVENRFYYLARRGFAEQQPELLAIVLEEFAHVSEWAAEHAEEAAKLLEQSSGIGFDALLRAERRHHYGVVPVDQAILAKQQLIADAFFRLQITPKAIRTLDALYVPKPLAPRQVASKP